jgi:putative metalloprotease
LAPILSAVIYGLISYRISVWRTHRAPNARSIRTADPRLKH